MDCRSMFFVLFVTSNVILTMTTGVDCAPPKAVEEENEENEENEDLNAETIEHYILIRTPGAEDVNIVKYSNGLTIENNRIPGVSGPCELVINFQHGENLTLKFGGIGSTIVPHQDNIDGHASTSSDANLEEVTILFNGEKVPGNIIGKKDIIIDWNTDRLMINDQIVPGVTGQDVMVIDYNRGGGITVNGKRTEGFDDIKGVGTTILLSPHSSRRVDSIRRWCIANRNQD